MPSIGRILGCPTFLFVVCFWQEYDRSIWSVTTAMNLLQSSVTAGHAWLQWGYGRCETGDKTRSWNKCCDCYRTM